MVKIRLRRFGKKNTPVYRVVVADKRSPRDGRIIEEIVSPQDAFVVGVRATPRVFVGHNVAVLT